MGHCIGVRVSNLAYLEIEKCCIDYKPLTKQNSYYRLANSNSGKALDLTTWSLNNGTAVVQRSYSCGRNQRQGFVKI